MLAGRRWRVVLGIPTPTVGLLRGPSFLASLGDGLVWPVPVPGVPLGPPRRTASLYPRLISCHPSGMALGRRLDCSRPASTASRRDAGILAGGRGRVSCGRHPRKPSPQEFTRTPAGVRGKTRGIERAATGGQALAGPDPRSSGPTESTWLNCRYTFGRGAVLPVQFRGPATVP